MRLGTANPSGIGYVVQGLELSQDQLAVCPSKRSIQRAREKLRLSFGMTRTGVSAAAKQSEKSQCTSTFRLMEGIAV